MTHVPLPPEEGDVEVGVGAGDGEVVPVLVVGGDVFTGGELRVVGLGSGRGFEDFGVTTVITRLPVPPCWPRAGVPGRVPAAG